MVVATTRTSTWMGAVPPTRSNSCSWSTRSSFAWRSSRISEISSRSSVPRFARSNAPLVWRSAPVNAPFSWPKSMLSTSDSGSAAQFTETNGPPRRSLKSWIARASSSLPVPDSPCNSTDARVGATARIVSSTRFSAALSPRIFRPAWSCATSSRNAAFSRRSRTSSSACSTASSSCCGRIGFVT